MPSVKVHTPFKLVVSTAAPVEMKLNSSTALYTDILLSCDQVDRKRSCAVIKIIVRMLYRVHKLLKMYNKCIYISHHPIHVVQKQFINFCSDTRFRCRRRFKKASFGAFYDTKKCMNS